MRYRPGITSEHLSSSPTGTVIATGDGTLAWRRFGPAKTDWERLRPSSEGWKPAGERGSRVFVAILKRLRSEPLYFAVEA